MQAPEQQASIVLPPHTPRDVLKTLIGAHIQHQIRQEQHLGPDQRKKLEDELTSEDELDKTVDELIERSDVDQPEVPIQFGFGVGAPIPHRED